MNKNQWQVSEADAGVRLDKWLAAADRLGSRSKALSAIERGKVFIDDAEQGSGDAGRRLQTGETIRLWMDRPGSAAVRYSARRDSGLHIIYEDASLIVINKPAGILTVPLHTQPDEPSILDQVKYHLRSMGKRQPLIVHRIDRDTSGLVVFAKTGEAQHNLKRQFELHEAERIYLAVVYGRPDPPSGEWRDLLVWDREELIQRGVAKRSTSAKEAICRYKILEKFKYASLLEVRLVTGKRNQIRIQAGLRGHPLIGERIYVYDSPPIHKIDFARQALHAFQLKFKHPADAAGMGRAASLGHQRSDGQLSFEAPMPADLNLLLSKLSR